MVTCKNNVPHEGIHLLIFEMLTSILIQILTGHSKVDHENITANPILYHLAGRNWLNGPNLSASYLHLLKRFEFFRTADKFTGGIQLVWLYQNIVRFDVQVKVADTVQLLNSFQKHNTNFKHVCLSQSSSALHENVAQGFS
jgi:hypothetical protein